MAAYQSLTGVDVFYWFSTGEAEWSNQDRGGVGLCFESQMGDRDADGPGPVSRGGAPVSQRLPEGRRPVVEEHRSLRQIWERVPPMLAEDPGYDPNRDLGDTARRSGLKGRSIRSRFWSDQSKCITIPTPRRRKLADLSGFIDHKNKIVRSNTGQVRFDYGHGVCTIDAPAAQGVTGFLKTVAPVELSTVTIDSENTYASVLVVSLDGEALSQSRSVLVQVGTRARPTGWVQRDGHFQGRRRQANFPRQASGQHGYDALGRGRHENDSDREEPRTQEGKVTRH